MSTQRVLKLEAPFDCGMTQYGLGATLEDALAGASSRGEGCNYIPLPPTYN